MRLLTLAIISLLSVKIAFAQLKTVIVPVTTDLPKDTLVSKTLISSLNGFWAVKDQANEKNQYIDPDTFLETAVLVDEMREIEQSSRLKNNDFYKTYLTAITPLDSTHWLIKLASMGINEQVPSLRACFELIALKKANKIYFSSPLKRNTTTWPSLLIDDFMVRYKNPAQKSAILTYIRNAQAYDRKLSVKGYKTEMYLCDDFPEVLTSTGVSYKSDYSKYTYNSLSSRLPKAALVIKGQQPIDELDPHDLWHDRLRIILPSNQTNKPVDEGCAYLYGGSWGISWKQILKQFKEKLASNPDTNWLDLYENSHNFGDRQDKYLMAGYVINALIVQKIEKDQGFGSVLELLKCGRYEKGNANYFKTLEKLTGINRANFNEKVWALVKDA